MDRRSWVGPAAALVLVASAFASGLPTPSVPLEVEGQSDSADEVHDFVEGLLPDQDAIDEAQSATGPASDLTDVELRPNGEALLRGITGIDSHGEVFSAFFNVAADPWCRSIRVSEDGSKAVLRDVKPSDVLRIYLDNAAADEEGNIIVKGRVVASEDISGGLLRLHGSARPPPASLEAQSVSLEVQGPISDKPWLEAKKRAVTDAFFMAPRVAHDASHPEMEQETIAPREEVAFTLAVTKPPAASHVLVGFSISAYNGLSNQDVLEARCGTVVIGRYADSDHVLVTDDTEWFFGLIRAGTAFEYTLLN